MLSYISLKVYTNFGTLPIKYKLSLSNFLHNDPIIDSIIDNQEQRECLCDAVNLIELSNQLEHEFLNTIK